VPPAHASGMMYGLRFDIEYEFMTKNSLYVGTTTPTTPRGRRAAQQARAARCRVAGGLLRPLAEDVGELPARACNKCHAKD